MAAGRATQRVREIDRRRCGWPDGLRGATGPHIPSCDIATRSSGRGVLAVFFNPCGQRATAAGRVEGRPCLPGRTSASASQSDGGGRVVVIMQPGVRAHSTLWSSKLCSKSLVTALGFGPFSAAIVGQLERGPRLPRVNGTQGVIAYSGTQEEHRHMTGVQLSGSATASNLVPLGGGSGSQKLRLGSTQSFVLGRRP